MLVISREEMLAALSFWINAELIKPHVDVVDVNEVDGGFQIELEPHKEPRKK